MNNYKLIFTDTFDFSKTEIIKKLSLIQYELIKKDINKVVIKNLKLNSIKLIKLWCHI